MQQSGYNYAITINFISIKNELLLNFDYRKQNKQNLRIAFFLQKMKARNPVLIQTCVLLNYLNGMILLVVYSRHVQKTHRTEKHYLASYTSLSDNYVGLHFGECLLFGK